MLQIQEKLLKSGFLKNTVLMLTENGIIKYSIKTREGRKISGKRINANKKKSNRQKTLQISYLNPIAVN